MRIRGEGKRDSEKEEEEGKFPVYGEEEVKRESSVEEKVLPVRECFEGVQGIFAGIAVEVSIEGIHR